MGAAFKQAFIKEVTRVIDAFSELSKSTLPFLYDFVHKVKNRKKDLDDK